MSIMENECVMEIINFYKKEFKEKLEIALTPFMVDLKTPIQIIIQFGEI